tara:strand:+ start:18103 stop:18603 length:501 start_codon:yes stop_codon:yes gene_type:complete
MNIFVLDKEPTIAAKHVLDKHAVKMPLESLQMMSTIADHLGFDSPYRPVMLNHPCTIWARKSRQNFLWLWEHAGSLCEEYTSRYGKTHKCELTMNDYNHVWIEVVDSLPDTGLTPFAIAIADNMFCRQVEGFDKMSTVDKYRQYYIHDKKRIATWRKNKPSWYGVA